jgi:hypothetical protein
LSIDARCKVRRKGGERGVTGAGVSHGADAMARGAVSGVQLMPETIGTRQASLREATRHALREGYRGRRRGEHFVHREPVHRSGKKARPHVARDRARVPGRRRRPERQPRDRPRFPRGSEFGAQPSRSTGTRTRRPRSVTAAVTNEPGAMLDHWHSAGGKGSVPRAVSWRRPCSGLTRRVGWLCVRISGDGSAELSSASRSPVERAHAVRASHLVAGTVSLVERSSLADGLSAGAQTVLRGVGSRAVGARLRARTAAGPSGVPTRRCALAGAGGPVRRRRASYRPARRSATSDSAAEFSRWSCFRGSAWLSEMTRSVMERRSSCPE